MSGIGVIFHRNGRPVRRDEIEKVARALRIYGPERLVFKLAGPVAFAYAHMSNTPESIFDDQPLQSGDGSFIMVFDGKLDNREDVQLDLNISHREAAVMSDGRLALMSFEKHGERAPELWVGEFAFIIWDKRKSILCAARDQLGRRVLNWHETSDRIVIASAAKGIFALGVPKEIDEQKIADALGQLFHDQTRSFFKDIKRLPHAQILVASHSGTRFGTYWDIRNAPSIRFRHDDDYVEAAWEQLDRAVQAHMRSHGPVGAFMSGGWDSSTVAITAAKLLTPEIGKLPVFTSVPQSDWDGGCLEREYGDETPYVQAIARKHPRIEVNLVPAEGLNHYHLRDEFIDAAEVPTRGALNLCWGHEIESQAKKRGITTLLEGTTGNLTLTWHGADVSREWVQQGHWIRMLHHWWALYGGRNRSLMRFLPRAIWHELVAADAPEWIWRLYRSRSEKPSGGPRWQRFSGINPSYAAKMSLESRAKAYQFNYFDRTRYYTRADRLSMITTSFMNEYGPIYQGMRALHGVEVRDPLADRRLMEFSIGIPTDQYARQGRNRWLIERMMSKQMPDEIVSRKKMAGRQCADWHSRMTPDLPRMKTEIDTLEMDSSTSAMIDTKRLKMLLEEWPEKTIIDRGDDRFFFLPTVIPLTTHVGRFVRLTKGAND